MQSVNQQKTLDKLASLRKQVELLESHKTVDFVTPKQYNESANRILMQLEELETEYGIYEDNTLNRDFNLAFKELEKIEQMLTELAIYFDEQNYNLAIQLALDGIMGEIKNEQNWSHIFFTERN